MSNASFNFYPNTDKLRILDLLRTEYAFVGRTLALLTPAQMLAPNTHGKWSGKDLVAHLTAWQRRFLNWVMDHRSGKPVYVPEQGFTWQQMDQLNDLTVERDRPRPLDEVLHEFHATYTLIEQLILDMPEQELLSPHPWTDGRPLWDVLKSNTWEHYIEHFPRLRASFKS